MTGTQFEIYRYGKNGELLRRIRCLSRRITVFRAKDQRNLEAFSSCLFGEHTEDRFSLLLNGESFLPNSKYVISERFSEKKDIKVETLLHGISSREAFLISHGLGGVSKLSLLALEGWQREAVLLFFAAQEKISPIIMEDPFKDAPQASRESIAQFLLNHVADHDIVVVATQLSSRPECWIDNEFVVRAQLEPPRKRTIGFGSGTSVHSEAEIYHALESIRNSHNALPKGKLLTSVASLHKNTKMAIASGATLGLILGCSVLFLLGQFTSQKNTPTSSSFTEALQPEMSSISQNNNLGTQDKINILEVKNTLMLGQPQYLLSAWKQAFSGSSFKKDKAEFQEIQKWETDTQKNESIKSFYDELNG